MDRLIEIETKLTDLEDTVQILNASVYRQQGQIDQLQALCAALAAEVRAMAPPAGEVAGVQEKPPHY